MNKHKSLTKAQDFYQPSAKNSNDLSPDVLKSRIKNFVLEKIKSQQNKILNKSGLGGNNDQQTELKKLTNNRRSTILKARHAGDQTAGVQQSPNTNE